MKKENFIQGSLFEEDYLVRTLGALVHSPDVALTELVANAWDAGATEVKIIIPDDKGDKLIIEDNGIGLTKDEFHQRWMKLGYNRIRHQGKKVVFPKGVNSNRLAYGRNGIGRHGMLCFNNEYAVISTSHGSKSIFQISTGSENQPFVLKDEKEEKSEFGHGTRLEVYVNKNLPKPERILDVISARFLHDPQFSIKINGKSVPLENHSGLINTTEKNIEGINITMHFIDSNKTARSTIYQGVAFWQSNRLIGEPSWILGTENIIDGRTKFAKRYTIVVKTNDLEQYILEDWTGFKKDEKIAKVHKCVSEYANEMFGNISRENIEETKKSIKKDYGETINKLSPLGQYEVDEAIENIALNHPTARPEFINLAIETIINLEKTRSGKELINRLSKLTDDDVEGLNKILSQWTIKDALCVLDEIDRRISIIEAIKKLSGDKEIDELKILHPLITEARWLFGPEFDSPEFVSNRQLKTLVKELFSIDLGSEYFGNSKKRPDLAVKDDSTFSATCTESFDSETGMVKLERVLLIELKRGGFKLSRNERNQAVGYAEDITRHPLISAYVHAFVVGESLSKDMQPTSSVENASKITVGKVHIVTYGQLVDTAEKRLFRLREKLKERYDDMTSNDLLEKLEPMELGLKMNPSPTKGESVNPKD